MRGSRSNGRERSHPAANDADGPPPTTGLHHVTNICTDIERTRAFDEDVLGFHTVKMTENYDDPGTTVTDFESIYFNDPDGLVFEVATTGPGFGVDEEVPGTETIDPSA